MANMRFNHMELTYPIGVLDRTLRDEIGAFYSDVFGWETSDVNVVGQDCLFLKVDEGQFILCAESKKPIASPGYDHLGLLMDDRAEVDRILARCQEWQARDPRVSLKIYDDLVGPTVTVHAFYVRYLLPIQFDVQVLEYQAGAEPVSAWTKVARV